LDFKQWPEKAINLPIVLTTACYKHGKTVGKNQYCAHIVKKRKMMNIFCRLLKNR